MISYICNVDVRMETSSAEVQLGKCQKHLRTENEMGAITLPPFFKNIFIFRERKN